MVSAPSDSTHAVRAVFRRRDFRLYAASSLLANLGAQMLGVAVFWQVYAIGHRALDLGLVGLVQFVPAFGLSVPAGAIADRFDRRRVVAGAHLAGALAAAALFVLARSRASVPLIYGALFLVSASAAFEGPAGQALVPGLVPAEELPVAVTWTSTVWQVATVFGPAMGGALYAVTGRAAWVYASCAALLALASVLVASLSPGAAPAESEPGAVTWASVFAGFGFVRRRPVILESITLDLCAVLLGGATALLPIYAKDILHVGPSGLGVLRGAPAAGAALIALVLARVPLKRRAGKTLLACVALFGAATIVFGLSRSFLLSLAALVVVGAADMVSVVVRSTVVQLRTPAEMRGRVSAVSTMCIVASSHLGELESGVTAAWFGAVPSVVAGGVGTLVVVALYAFAFGSLRQVDRLDEAAA